MWNLKNEQGSITLFALVSCLFFVASVACVGMYMQSKQTAVDREYRQIRANYEVSIDKIKKSGEILNKNVTLFTEDNVLITIPAGFTVSKESPNVASEGIIITDSVDEEGNSNGNEFVWVPKGKLYQEIKEAGVGKYWNTAKDTDETAYNIKQYLYNGGTWTDNGGNKENVEKYGGFYIARFEAGLPSEIWTKGSTEYKWTNVQTAGSLSGDRNTNVTDYKPVSKKNNPSWNKISHINAVTVSNNMYRNSLSVTSSLIDSYAWDTVEEWIKESGKTVTSSTSYGNYMDSVINVNGLYAKHKYSWKSDSTGWKSYALEYLSGTYQTTNRSQAGDQELIEIATGSSENTKANNIYDLAGNMCEWTTETGTNTQNSGVNAVVRGGGFVNLGSGAPLCRRYGGYETNDESADVRISCRTLY